MGGTELFVDLEENPGMLIAEFNLNLLMTSVNINDARLHLSPPLNDSVKYILYKHI